MKKVWTFLLLIVLVGLVGCHSVETETATDYIQIIAELTAENTKLTTENEHLRESLCDSEFCRQHPIDIAYQETMSERVEMGDSSMVGMSSTTQEYAVKWREEMEKYLELLTEFLKDDEINWLSEAQDAWEVFARYNTRLEVQMHEYIFQQGSIMTIMASSTIYERYRSRALYLKSWYERLLDAPGKDAI